MHTKVCFVSITSLTQTDQWVATQVCQLPEPRLLLVGGVPGGPQAGSQSIPHIRRH